MDWSHVQPASDADLREIKRNMDPRREVPWGTSEVAPLITRIDQERAEVERLRAKVAQLTDDLYRYGSHDRESEGADRDCLYLVSQGDQSCDCGYEDALPALAKPQPEAVSHG